MPQVQLPIFPQGVTHITSEIAFECRDGKVTYFNGHLPVFIHDCEDLAAFRLFSSQLTINGNASQSQISRAFGVPVVTVKRYVKLYREKGPKGFFAPRPRRNGSKLTPERLAEAQRLLDEGFEVPEAARSLGILSNTMHKAIRAGRMQQRAKKKTSAEMQASTRRQKASAV